MNCKWKQDFQTPTMLESQQRRIHTHKTLVHHSLEPSLPLQPTLHEHPKSNVTRYISLADPPAPLLFTTSASIITQADPENGQSQSVGMT